MENLWLILVFIISYLLGSLPTAYLVIKRATGGDVRDVGTKNVGAMNVHRATESKKLFVLTWVIDMVKAVLAILIARWLMFLGYALEWGIIIAVLGVFLGHNWSVFLRFYGGKGISCLMGTLLLLGPVYLFIPWGLICIISILLTKRLVAGQIISIIALPFLGYFLAPYLAPHSQWLFSTQCFYLLVTLAIATPMFIRHASRIKPLIRGKEPKWYWKERR